MRFNKLQVTSTLEYLEVRQESRSHLKPECVNILMSRLHNLLPKDCAHCNETYVVDKDDECLLPCERCGVDVHRSCLLQLLKIEPGAG